MSRLFLAVWPPDELAEGLRGLPRKERPGIRWVPPDNWHVTLRFLGDADAHEIADRLDHVTLPAAAARYGPAIDLMWQRTIVVPVGGLDALAESAARATAGLGDQPPQRRFVGHLTVARVKRGKPIPDVIGLPVAATDDVTTVALVASTLRPTGAEYDTIASWPTR